MSLYIYTELHKRSVIELLYSNNIINLRSKRNNNSNTKDLSNKLALDYCTKSTAVMHMYVCMKLRNSLQNQYIKANLHIKELYINIVEA